MPTATEALPGLPTARGCCRALTTEIATTEKPTAERVREFLTEVAANALGGAFGVGISAGLGFFL
jgi:hypothetical protein